MFAGELLLGTVSEEHLVFEGLAAAEVAVREQFVDAAGAAFDLEQFSVSVDQIETSDLSVIENVERSVESVAE